MQDADRDLEQLVVGDLEQLVAREGLQDVRPAPCRRGCSVEAGALEYCVDLVAQQRDVAGAAAVGGRGEQADEQPLADHGTAVVFGITAFQNAQEAMIKVTLSLAQIAKMEALAKWGVEVKLLPKCRTSRNSWTPRSPAPWTRSSPAQGFDPKTVKITRA